MAAPSIKTMIRVLVNGCEGCTVGVQRGIEFGNPNNIRPAQPAYWEGMQAVVTNGFAAFEVTTKYTPGMSFTVRAPWEVDGASVTNIVLGSTESTGATVASAEAKKTRAATACWAGTTLPEVTIEVQVTKAAGFGYTNSAVSARAWASPTIATVGPLQ